MGEMETPPKKKKKSLDDLHLIKTIQSIEASDEKSEPNEVGIGLKAKLKGFLKYYLENSTIHGFKYISDSDNWFTRGFWIVALIASFLMCGFVLQKTYVKWQFIPEIGITKKLRPVQSIPFPTLTICPQTKARALLVSFEHLYRLRFEQRQKHGVSYNESVYFESLLHVCDPQLLKYLNLDLSILEKDFNIVPELRNMIYLMNDTIMFCKWRDDLVNCDDFFNEIFTDQGLCFSFNMLDYPDLYHKNVLHKNFEAFKFNQTMNTENWTLAGGYKTNDLNVYPWPIISHQYDGFRVILKITNVDMDFVCRGPNQGFKLFWNMPGEVPNALSRSLFIPIEQDVTISIKPTMTIASSNLLKYSPDLRECFLNRERQLKYFKTYSKSNCDSECLTNYTLATCGCVKFSMPHPTNTPVCNATKLKCVLDTERKWLSYGTDSDENLQCNCMPACIEIGYEPNLLQTNFDYDRMFKSYGYDLSKMPGVVMSRLSIYFESSDFEATERYAIFDSMDFLSSCGGLLGLFMGFSILSLIELGYFFILWIVMLRRRTGIDENKADELAKDGIIRVSERVGH